MNKVYLSVSILAVILFVTGADNTMALCIEKEKANLRKGPSTKQKKNLAGISIHAIQTFIN